MARSKRSYKDKPVRLYHSNHKALKKIAFLCEVPIELLTNAIMEKGLSDRDFMEKVLLELGANPRYLDES